MFVNFPRQMVSTGSCRYLFACSTLCWDYFVYQACISKIFTASYFYNIIFHILKNNDFLTWLRYSLMHKLWHKHYYLEWSFWRKLWLRYFIFFFNFFFFKCCIPVGQTHQFLIDVFHWICCVLIVACKVHGIHDRFVYLSY